MARFPDGPWTIEPKDERDHPGKMQISRPHHMAFAEVIVRMESDGQDEDNLELVTYAQLIARTPDVLAALKAMVVLVEKQGINDSNRSTYLKAAMILETFGV